MYNRVLVSRKGPTSAKHIHYQFTWNYEEIKHFHLMLQVRLALMKMETINTIWEFKMYQISSQLISLPKFNGFYDSTPNPIQFELLQVLTMIQYSFI